ncbi:haloacid dehalogenase [Aeromonas hydrophila]|uniref:HAD family phosphatase n=1 Tax=Aeromonas hydrophila TaxID=644 RepID=A0AAX3P935_AERHY|nr:MULTISPECIES: HAD family phosphatase [Aeromonas]GKQ63065.1 hydrolase [Aeromonas caviae]HDT5861842.1 HAD family phosphatase [Aeromonas hydrophila subsp. hydrophila]AUZ76272.1 HAD family phosphatase [Aeromonas sp. ASNIH4]MCO4114669.1 HAD family phosphatase [Aeromonas hydrophila]MCV9382220.1 HAD family phosphatase [Aeromonas hydrophila]
MAIIFDLGRVVVSWDPVGIVRSVRGEQGAELLAERLFNHPDWLEVDRGTLSLHTMARQAEHRTGLSAAENLAILQAVPASLVPDPAMLSLIESLHGAGHTLYALSNMGHASIDWLEQHQPFWRFFSGKVVSARVRMMKPEPDIYRYLLVSFDLQAEQCLFIDDSPANVTAAQALGIGGLVFTDAYSCRQQLVAQGYLPA